MRPWPGQLHVPDGVRTFLRLNVEHDLKKLTMFGGVSHMCVVSIISKPIGKLGLVIGGGGACRVAIYACHPADLYLYDSNYLNDRRHCRE
jgi:hypothetical protein